MEFPVYSEKGLLGRKVVWIKHADKSTVAYHVEFQGLLKDMTVRRGGPQGPVVGRIEFHTWTNSIDISFEDNTRVEMKKDGMFSSSFVVKLPASPNSPFKWKHTFRTLELKDSKGQYLASFKQRSGLSSKEGTFNLTASGISQALMDQIFVTFMAYQERLLKVVASGG